MNAVEIEEAVSELAEQPFDVAEFPFAFLQAFGSKETTIRRLRSGATNKSDQSGVLQTGNIHLKVCAAGEVTTTLATLKSSPATIKGKVRYLLATDGQDFEAEDLETGETVACAYPDFPNHFGFFLPLAGITTVRQIRESAFDIRATSRLNRLYVQLLKDNPDWGTEARRHDMNHFMARLIFCFFAEDTDIFHRSYPFTGTVEQMSARDSSNTHEVIAELFRAMNTPTKHQGNPDDRYRVAAGIKNWATPFPYVNGGLFSGNLDVPRFSRIARSYLLHIGGLDWKQINPDIFGSMIQAVAEDEERGALGMHYTSVPNILKVLTPLFLDDLNEKLAEAGDNARMLLNLRKRMARIRVFDPACGSGNFLVIAYKEMRKIEAEINRRRGEAYRPSEIALTNFRGIEIREFAAEIARLALIIAEYQCDVLYRGEKLALAEFLPLNAENWIRHGNALRLDWLSVCPPTGTGVRVYSDDLLETPLDQPQIDFENEGGETYICGNPPYFGSRRQQLEQKSELRALAAHLVKKWKSLDYVSGWLLKAAEYADSAPRCRFAFVCTSSVSEGLQVSLLWPHVLGTDRKIFFAHMPFKWTNLARRNAGVIVVVVGVIDASVTIQARLFGDVQQLVSRINPYLVPAETVYVSTRPRPLSQLPRMTMGSMPRDGGSLILDPAAARGLSTRYEQSAPWIRRYVGSAELINGLERYCLWISDAEASAAADIEEVARRLDAVASMRAASTLSSTREFADRPHRFVYLAGESSTQTIGVSGVSSERRRYLPVDIFDPTTVLSNLAFAVYDGPVWTIGLIASRLHLSWIAAVCGKLKADFRYSNTLGWNTFPVPPLTEKNKADLTTTAEGILLAREAHFPATIADLYDPDKMPTDLRAAHERNDEVLERIYIGRRFKNDTERLEKLFELYTRMVQTASGSKKRARADA